ncbi:MAG: hypothetical protein WC516_06595 [Patescibacteria group bacterium]|jgi:hypothetical protein
MALTKNYNYKGIELPEAYFSLHDVRTDYKFRKSFTDDNGNSTSIKGRAMVDIGVYQNKEAYQRGDQALEVIPDIPFEGENFVYDPEIRPTITGAKSYKNGGEKDNPYDVNDQRWPIYCQLKKLKPKNSQLDFSTAKDC